ncbi:MAG: PIN domain-containing protein [Xanthomonadales bacterium]|nr:PIN domain-containing protein [Xanthomonadales bacterium]
MRFVVVYDACVLYPAPLRDLLIRLATTRLFAARWSNQIHEEWIRNVQAKRPDLHRAQLERTRDFMNDAVPDCLVSGHERLVPALDLPDPDDRHVLAAAIMAHAQMIVTFNLRDFPPEKLEPFGIEAIHPDRFIECQMDLREAAVIQAARDQRQSLKKPARTVDEFLDTLAAQGLPVSADRLREFQELI